MALRTSHALVHAAQRILGGVVIEFGDGADRLPAAKRVTVLARNAQASVRTARVGGRLRLSAHRLSAGKHGKRDYQMNQKRRAQGCPNLARKDFDSRDGNSCKIQ